ncbi:hypothetical protein [Bacillus sp. SRB3LM]|uniref:hypothetical protein n=1 Tax=Bacillus sp. SRB3LM TaxID=2608689 RepID=UPI0018C3688E|nr:hypothetical protein [Bacillus sp. SRB3LM]MBG0967499.1 hypothetical protein [Bacillus sp. SRB3LM]
MLKFPVLEAKRNLFVQTLIKAYDITDDGLIQFLKQCTSEECDLYIHELQEALPYMFDFDFDWIDVPHEVSEDHADGWNYFIVGAIRVPALLPYADQPAFIEFTRNIEILTNTSCGNLIEFVYLPDSKIASSDDPVHSTFANQPGTFMIGMQDNGGLDINETIEFLTELRDVNDSIISLVEGRELPHD